MSDGRRAPRGFAFVPTRYGGTDSGKDARPSFRPRGFSHLDTGRSADERATPGNRSGTRYRTTRRDATSSAPSKSGPPSARLLEFVFPSVRATKPKISSAREGRKTPVLGSLKESAPGSAERTLRHRSREPEERKPFPRSEGGG